VAIIQLNVSTDYAIRALVYLAEENGTVRVIRGVEIAEKMQIPPTYLIAIMKPLKSAGFVTVKRGNVGGYQLAKSPSEISLWDIMVVMEDSMQLDRHVEHDTFSEQTDTGMGQVRSVYRSLQGILEDQLRAVTLDKLTG
jgi:Rrf2 family protein